MCSLEGADNNFFVEGFSAKLLYAVLVFGLIKKEGLQIMFKRIILVATLLLVAASAQADYKLDNKQSTFNFISIKKGKIAETHTFNKITGSIAANGAANMSIDLNSVETHIATRNERMKTMLFETVTFPAALISTNIDIAQLEGLQVGEMMAMPVVLSVNLHGKSKEMATVLSVVKLSNSGVLVTTTKPILLNAFDFGLDTGIQALMDVAKLPSIATAVPVSFSLVFKRE